MSGSILTDVAISRAVANQDIVIDPYRASHVNPASYDLTLGDQVLVYAADSLSVYDVKQEPTKFRHALIGDEGFVIHPGVGYLMHTHERVLTESYVPVLDGKSSIGRLFISVHSTAGYGDPGFDGQYTLEVTAHHFSVRLYAGMRIAQMRFHTMEGKLAKTYEGNYRGATAKGPVPSAAWRQFAEKKP
jgi:dCTP deaminase